LSREFIATGSFFLGQAKVIPKPIRIIPLLAILALLPLVLTLYWLARALFTQRVSPKRLTMHSHGVQAYVHSTN